jgi:SPOR domain
MSSGSSRPEHPSAGLQPADVATWDHDGAIARSAAYRHALWLETGGLPQGEPGPGFARVENAMPEMPELAQQSPPRPAAIARLTAAARGPRALLLIAAGVAGVASGMLVSGHDLLPDGRPLLEHAWRTAATLMPGAMEAERSALAGATLTSTAQAGTIAVAARATPAAYAPPPRLAAPAPAVASAPPPQPPATARRRPGAEVFEGELIEGVVLAAALDDVPAWQAAALQQPARAEPAAPAVEHPAAYRVQLATLRDRRNAGPVWRDFASRVTPLAGRLERYVTAAETAHGLRYLVQVGPFADEPGAIALCDRILQKGGDCVVVPPSS